MIIVSTVRSSTDMLSYDAKFALGFLSNARRFNGEQLCTSIRSRLLNYPLSLSSCDDPRESAARRRRIEDEAEPGRYRQGRCAE